MRSKMTFLAIVISAVIMVPIVGAAQDAPKIAPKTDNTRETTKASSAEKTSQPRQIDQRVLDIIKKINEEALELDFAKSVSEDVIEEMVDGVKLNYTQIRTVIIKRPDQILVDSRGDIANKTIVNFENKLALYDHDEHVYSEIEIKGPLEDYKDNVLIPYGLSIPLAEFISTTPYTSLMKLTKEARYLGEGLVGDVPCHHILFIQENLDWQLWVDKTDDPFPRRIVITYKNEEGQPQYTSTFLSMEELTGDVKDAINYKPDPDMVKIEFMPLDIDKK